MSKLYSPVGYKPRLSAYETQIAIGKIKRTFEDKLSQALNLKRVSAPLFVAPETGLNDDLNGIERPVEFDVLETKRNVQIVHSLAKWKRMALHKYGFPAGEGLYTDMNAIRRDEDMDNLHSIYVDQWDWEKIILRAERNLDTLKNTVEKIVGAICDTEESLLKKFPLLGNSVNFKRDVAFVTAQELEDLYPSLSSKERENEYVKKYGTVFVMQIGGVLKSGEKHDGRAPDYDDWAFNGDLLLWSEVLNSAVEITSMGIRVDEDSLNRQLNEANCNHRRELQYHKMLLNGELPLTIGGGIGQSRLSMLLLGKAHIGEVHVSVWDDETIESCKKAGIELL